MEAIFSWFTPTMPILLYPIKEGVASKERSDEASSLLSLKESAVRVSKVNLIQHSQTMSVHQIVLGDKNNLFFPFFEQDFKFPENIHSPKNKRDILA